MLWSYVPYRMGSPRSASRPQSGGDAPLTAPPAATSRDQAKHRRLCGRQPQEVIHTSDASFPGGKPSASLRATLAYTMTKRS
jgi:hypothetical protein